MGRTKVRPDARRRVVRACQACKTGKRRCDGQQPCSRCATQNRASECRYQPPKQQTLTTPRAVSASVARSHTSQAPESPHAHAHASIHTQSPPSAPSPAAQHVVAEQESVRSQVVAQSSTNSSCMLNSSHGEKCKHRHPRYMSPIATERITPCSLRRTLCISGFPSPLEAHIFPPRREYAFGEP